MGTARLGAIGEELAARHLEAAGLEIVARNWRCADGPVRGELDIIAREGRVIAFVEVKSRRGTTAGSPLEAITPAKVARLRRLAGAWLARTALHPAEVRLDAVGVCWRTPGAPPEIVHLRGIG